MSASKAIITVCVLAAITFAFYKLAPLCDRESRSQGAKKSRTVVKKSTKSANTGEMQYAVIAKLTSPIGDSSYGKSSTCWWITQNGTNQPIYLSNSGRPKSFRIFTLSDGHSILVDSGSKATYLALDRSMKPFSALSEARGSSAPVLLNVGADGGIQFSDACVGVDWRTDANGGKPSLFVGAQCNRNVTSKLTKLHVVRFGTDCSKLQ
jgi:hypothetical protein